MSEQDTIPNLLTAAEQAVAAGDLAGADALLKDIARIQEAELGPDHPDLASTMNNLAVVAEQAGRPDDAEACYRRAVAIASKSLPADDPMVAATRQNLEEFCQARGIPIDRPVIVERPADTVDTVDAVDPVGTIEPVAPVAPAPSVLAREDAASETPPPASRSLVPIAIGVVVLAAVVLLVMRPWSSRDAAPIAAAPPPTSTPAPVAAPPSAEPPAVQPAPPPAAPAPPAAAAPVERPRPAESPRAAEPSPPASKPPAPPGARSTPPKSGSAITLATTQLCKALSTGGRAWRCDPVDDPVRPGSLVLYTRVRSPRDDVVVHRWYRGNALRQSVTLKIRASPTEGYRTYSRQAVDGSGEWRVEVTDAAGNVLHEQRIAVR